MLTKVFKGNTTQEVMDFTMVECCNCGTPFFMTTRLREAFKKNGDWFYCPNGHQQHYSKTTEQILKEKLEEEKARAKKEAEDLTNRLLDTLNEKNKLQRQLKRVHKGTCPCCKKSFENLKRHIASKHPELLETK
jgi:hypothetical protein